MAKKKSKSRKEDDKLEKIKKLEGPKDKGYIDGDEFIKLKYNSHNLHGYILLYSRMYI